MVAIAEEFHGVADVGEPEMDADGGGPVFDGDGDDLDGSSADLAHRVVPVAVLAPFVVGHHVHSSQAVCKASVAAAHREGPAS